MSAGRRHGRSRARAARGGTRAPAFTLLEVMLAVAILGIVATTVYGTFSRTLRSKTIVEERIDLTRTGRSALGRMTEELAAAFYPTPSAPGAVFRGLPGGTESQPRDALVFSALSTRPTGADARDTDQRVISYFFPVADGRMRRERVAPRADDVEDVFAAFEREPLRVPGTEPERLLRRETLMSARSTADASALVFLEDVASLAFRFHDGSDWLDRWDSEDRANYRPLPRAVAIDLALYDDAGEVHHFTTAVDLALADTRPGPRRSPGPATPTPGGAGSPRPAATPRAG